jgi:hypothetical protein
MARDYGYKKFLETPVHQLEVPERLKAIFKSFKAYTLQQCFIIYKVEDFGRASIFKKVVEFQIYAKEEALISR